MERLTEWPGLLKLAEYTSNSGVVDFSHEYSVGLTKDQMQYIIDQNSVEAEDLPYSEKEYIDYGKNRKLARFKMRKRGVCPTKVAPDKTKYTRKKEAQE
jgi:hypothetical protein